MDEILRRIRRIFIPRISSELQREIDKHNVRNLNLISTVCLCLETVLLVVYILRSLNGFGEEQLHSTLRVCFCILVCAVNMAVALRLRKKEHYGYRTITLITVVDFLLLMGWAIYTAYLQELREEQYFTFYTVLLCFVCFVCYRPLVACFLTVAAYGGLGIMMERTGGGLGITPANFIALAVLTAVAMIARYDQQIKVSRTFLELESKNRDLSITSRRDALTGLNNREALSQDRKLFYNESLTVVMADIDGFKQVNDVHGHAVGDRALRQAAQVLRETYPGALIYRYGGDEFLAVFRNMDMQAATEATTKEVRFTVPIRSGNLPLRLSSGIASGQTAGEQELKALIDMADARMYEQKRLWQRESSAAAAETDGD